MTSNQTSTWAFQKIIDKAAYDISASSNTDLNRIEDYIRHNAFLATILLDSGGTPCHIGDAQRRFNKAFGKYHATEMRKQCLSNGKVTRRNKKLQPLAFMAFDIEGTRHNGFNTVTAHPHGHGAVIFHERTLANFEDANKEFLTLEGGYKISNPTPGISLVDLKPVNSFEDLARFLTYSLKLEGKLKNNDTNYAPYDFYPAWSVDFPFWSFRAPVPALSPLPPNTTRGATNEGERIWSLHSEDCHQCRPDRS
ncbi:hypothetical protein [Rhizobium subbaraonis]|uniref:hypothetical protein n=1 Tax=Rhizobium subbaraonis TaxID=908946 RepID=UPI001142C041|nr:hypothetical protein [Rhizobium subbaraonis]